MRATDRFRQEAERTILPLRRSAAYFCSMTTTTMNYQLLGRSGLRVSDLCLGAMTFGEDWGWGTAKDEARKIYDTHREAGGNFIDTANIYRNGSSEKLVGEFIARRWCWPRNTPTPSSGSAANRARTRTRAATSLCPWASRMT